MKKALTREEYLGADDLPLKWVELPAALYGEDAGVYVRTMTGDERSDLEKAWAGNDPRTDPGGFRWAVLSATIVNEDGAHLFLGSDDSEAAGSDERAVMGKNAGVLEMLFEESCHQNGFREKDVKDIEKNSESGQ